MSTARLPHRDRIREHLLKKLSVSDYLLDRLCKEDVLTEQDKETVAKIHSRDGQTRCCVDILMRQPLASIEKVFKIVAPGLYMYQTLFPEHTNAVHQEGQKGSFMDTATSCGVTQTLASVSALTEDKEWESSLIPHLPDVVDALRPTLLFDGLRAKRLLSPAEYQQFQLNPKCRTEKDQARTLLNRFLPYKGKGSFAKFCEVVGSVEGQEHILTETLRISLSTVAPPTEQVSALTDGGGPPVRPTRTQHAATFVFNPKHQKWVKPLEVNISPMCSACFGMKEKIVFSYDDLADCPTTLELRGSLCYLDVDAKLAVLSVDGIGTDTARRGCDSLEHEIVNFLQKNTRQLELRAGTCRVIDVTARPMDIVIQLDISLYIAMLCALASDQGRMELSKSVQEALPAYHKAVLRLGGLPPIVLSTVSEFEKGSGGACKQDSEIFRLNQMVFSTLPSLVKKHNRLVVNVNRIFDKVDNVTDDLKHLEYAFAFGKLRLKALQNDSQQQVCGTRETLDPSLASLRLQRAELELEEVSQCTENDVLQRLKNTSSDKSDGCNEQLQKIKSRLEQCQNEQLQKIKSRLEQCQRHVQRHVQRENLLAECWFDIGNKESFRRVLAVGTVCVYRAHINVVGQSRGGKTCFVRALLKLGFEPQISTNGVAVKIVDISTQNWKESKDGGHYNKVVAMGLKRAQQRQQQESEKSKQTVQTQGSGLVQEHKKRRQQQLKPGSAVSDAGVLQRQKKQKPKRKSPVTDARQPTGVAIDFRDALKEADLTEEDRRCIMKLLEDPNLLTVEEGEIFLARISDYAGQEPFLLAHAALCGNCSEFRCGMFIIVFNQTKLLSDKAVSEYQPDACGPPQLERLCWVNLYSDFIAYWLTQLRSAFPEQIQSELCRRGKSKFDTDYDYPLAMVVGTHDTEPDAEKNRSQNNKILEELFTEKKYQGHLLKPDNGDQFYRVDNTRSGPEHDEDPAGEVRGVISSVAEDIWVGQEQPVKYFVLEKILERLVQISERHVIDLSFFEALATNLCHIGKEDIHRVLLYLDSVRAIVYRPDKKSARRDAIMEGLKDKVFIDPQWLVRVVNTFITASMKKPQLSRFHFDWDRIKTTGIITRKLILEHLFETAGVQREHYTAVLSMLCLIDFICPVGKCAKLEECKKFYAPGMINSLYHDTPKEKFKWQQWNADNGLPPPLVLTPSFMDTFPEPLYQRLVVRTLEKYSTPEERIDIHRDRCLVPINMELDLELVYQDRTHVVITVISDETPEPSRYETLSELREFLEIQVDDARQTDMRGFEFKLCAIPKKGNLTEEDLHESKLVPLNESGQYISRKVSEEIRRIFNRWFNYAGETAFSTSQPMVQSRLSREDSVDQSKIGPDSMPEDEFREGMEAMGKAVCLITVQKCKREFGTGFLVGRDLVLTSCHLIPNRITAKKKATFKFNFIGSSKPDEQLEFQFKNGGLFVGDSCLDFSLIQLISKSQSSNKHCVDLTAEDLPRTIGRVSMSEAVKDASQLGPDTGVVIIQHPSKRRREVAVHGTLLGGPRDNKWHDNKWHANKWLLHSITTEQGSSGSPIFDDRFHLIGIHKGETEKTKKMQKPANRGLFIGAVLEKLKSAPVDTYDGLSEANKETLKEFIQSCDT